MKKIFNLLLILVLGALPVFADEISGSDAIAAINSFLNLKDGDALRMGPSIRFEPEFADCDTIVQNFPGSMEISVGRTGKFSVKMDVLEYENYTAKKLENKTVIRNARGVELALERRIPSRSPDGSEISVKISDNGTQVIHCLIVR